MNSEVRNTRVLNIAVCIGLFACGIICGMFIQQEKKRSEKREVNVRVGDDFPIASVVSSLSDILTTFDRVTFDCIERRNDGPPRLIVSATIPKCKRFVIAVKLVIRSEGEDDSRFTADRNITISRISDILDHNTVAHDWIHELSDREWAQMVKSSGNLMAIGIDESAVEPLSGFEEWFNEWHSK